MTVLSAGARKPMLGTHYQGASMNVIRMESADRPSPVIGEHTDVFLHVRAEYVERMLTAMRSITELSVPVPLISWEILTPGAILSVPVTMNVPVTRPVSS